MSWLLDLSWQRPWGFGLFLLPLILLWLLRRERKPSLRATGTLDLWLVVAQRSSRSATGSARRLPPRILWLVTSLLAAALAVAGPKVERPPAPSRWQFEVDRSPSMFLPVSSTDSRTRYEQALQTLADWLDSEGIAKDARRWRSSGFADVLSALPPADWARAPRSPSPELSWHEGLEASLWNRISDRLPEVLPTRGGWVTSGGQAIPGVVAEHEQRFLRWDGERLLEGDAAPKRQVYGKNAWPEPLAALAAIWVEERGLEWTDEAQGAELILEGPGVEGGDSLVLIGGPWTLRGQGIEGPPGDSRFPHSNPGDWNSGTSWPATARDDSLVSWSPGWIGVGLSAVDEVLGDRAALALAWSELLDEALLPNPQVVSQAERRSAGPAEFRAPVPSTATTTIDSNFIQPGAWLALIATLCALIALLGSALPRRIG